MFFVFKGGESSFSPIFFDLGAEQSFRKSDTSEESDRKRKKLGDEEFFHEKLRERERRKREQSFEKKEKKKKKKKQRTTATEQKHQREKRVAAQRELEESFCFPLARPFWFCAASFLLCVFGVFFCVCKIYI